MVLFADESFFSVVRRLSLAQSSDGARVFIGTVRIEFREDGHAYLAIEEKVFTTPADEQIDVRVIRDPGIERSADDRGEPLFELTNTYAGATRSELDFGGAADAPAVEVELVP